MLHLILISAYIGHMTRIIFKTQLLFLVFALIILFTFFHIPLIMPSLVHLVIYLCLHACSARPLMVLDSVAQVQGLNRIEPETFVSRGNVIVEYGGKISDGTTAIQFENQRTSAVKGTEGKTGSPLVKILCSRKMLQEAAERMAWKRSERSTPESPPSNGEETVNSKDNRIAEDVVVIDYEQPHRKPPIHNWEP